MTEVERLTKIVDDMTMSAARSAIALLHSFGLSGQEAEDLVKDDGPKPAVQPDPPKDVDSFITKITVENPITSVLLIQFDRLVRLRSVIRKIETDQFVAYNVSVWEWLEDHQLYRCFPEVMLYK